MQIPDPDPLRFDPEDLRLVRALQIAPRAPWSTLARALDRSESALVARHRRLQHEGRLHVVGAVDTAALGFEQWMVRLRCRPDRAARLAASLARRDDVRWVAIGDGGSEVTCAVLPRRAHQRDELLADRLPRAEAVLDIRAALILHQFIGERAHWWWALAGVLTTAEEAALGASGIPFEDRPRAAGAVRLSEQDEALIVALERDGRAGPVALAAADGTSRGRAGRRLDRLLSTGAVYLDVEVVPRSLGLAAGAHLWLEVHPARTEEVGRALAAMEEVAFAAAVSGRQGLVAVVHAPDLHGLYRLVADRVGALPGILAVELTPLTAQVKQAGTAVAPDGRLVVPSAIRA